MPRKSIDFSETDINIIKEFQTQKGIKSFTESVRTIIRMFGDGSLVEKDGDFLSDDNFALLADAIVKLDNKIDLVVANLAPPKSAGEVK